MGLVRICKAHCRPQSGVPVSAAERVREARLNVKYAGYGVPDAMLDAFAAAVRAETLAEVREAVHSVPCWIRNGKIAVEIEDVEAVLSKLEAP